MAAKGQQGADAKADEPVNETTTKKERPHSGEKSREPAPGNHYIWNWRWIIIRPFVISDGAWNMVFRHRGAAFGGSADGICITPS
ncbi:MAG: hypothetical protein PHW76_00105 [Alphaproteobacteria bacterium]|nr:hypothetical protein [Alphaproteobacteria bacterium]